MSISSNKTFENKKNSETANKYQWHSEYLNKSIQKKWVIVQIFVVLPNVCAVQNKNIVTMTPALAWV